VCGSSGIVVLDAIERVLKGGRRRSYEKGEVGLGSHFCTSGSPPSFHLQLITTILNKGSEASKTEVKTRGKEVRYNV
jgi:hypothetical protein